MVPVYILLDFVPSPIETERKVQVIGDSSSFMAIVRMYGKHIQERERNELLIYEWTILQGIRRISFLDGPEKHPIDDNLDEKWIGLIVKAVESVIADWYL